MAGREHESNLTNDPLIGTQRHPDQAVEQRLTPEREAAADPTHGRPERSRVVAGVLGILFGFLGLHRFYLGFYKVGGFQLMLSALIVVVMLSVSLATGQSMLAMLPAVAGVLVVVWLWGFIEGVMILLGMMRHDGDGHPLQK